MENLKSEDIKDTAYFIDLERKDNFIKKTIELA